MNRQQTAQLFAVIRNGYDPRIVASETEVIAWHDLLSRIELDDAVAAVKAHYASTTDRIMVAHVLKGARAVARDRALRAMPSELAAAPRNPEQSHQGYLAAIQTVTEALRTVKPQTAEGPDLSQPCPWCRARVGVACTTNGTARSSNHPSRPTKETA